MNDNDSAPLFENDDAVTNDQPLEEPTRNGGSEIQEIGPEPQGGQGEAVVSKPSFIKRLLTGLFSPDTRAGKILRPFLRTAALVVGCFALGLLAAYLLLYRPQTQLLEKTSTDLESALLSRQIAETHAAITQLELDQAKSSADAANWRSGYLSVLAPINAARWALASGDKVETRTYLEAARQAFDTFLPQLTEKDPQAAEAIQARLELVENGVASDPDTALTDLTLLAGTLEKLAQ